MSRYDGLIIPRSYSEYINKTDAATLLQALQLSGVMDNAPTADSNHPIKSGGVKTALNSGNTLIDLINALGTGDDEPNDDNDYFISQYVNGGETNKIYYRRRISTLVKKILSLQKVTDANDALPTFQNMIGFFYSTYGQQENVPNQDYNWIIISLQHEYQAGQQTRLIQIAIATDRAITPNLFYSRTYDVATGLWNMWVQI